VSYYKIRDIVISLGLTDITETYFEIPLATYKRSNMGRRIDFLLDTPSVVNSVTIVQIALTSIGDKVGDHKAMMVDFNIASLLERTIRKIYLVNYMWSPQLDAATEVLQYWKQRQKVQKTHQVGL